MQTSTCRRLTLVAILGGGVWLGLTMADGAAHADDGTAQRPGGTLGTVVGVVDQVVPAEPEPELSEEPAAEPEPTEPAEQAPAEVPPVDVPPVVIDPPPVVTPPVVTPPPVVIVTPPVVAPTPTPTPAPEQPTVQLPVDLDEPADEVEATLPTEPVVATVPIDLPVLIGPLPGRTLDDGIRAAEPAGLPEPPSCDDPDRDPAQPRGDGKQHRRSNNQPAHSTTRPARPCPAPAGPDGQAVTVGAVKPPPPTGEQLVADSAAGAYSRPVLHRLTQMRARSHTLAGRTEHPEPGPA